MQAIFKVLKGFQISLIFNTFSYWYNNEINHAVIVNN